MSDIREQETQTCIYIHTAAHQEQVLHSYALEIMVGSSSRLSRIKTHRTNTTSIDFYLGLFLIIFHKSIHFRTPLCPLNIARNMTVEYFWHALSHLAIHTHVSKETSLGNQYTNPDRHTGCYFCEMPLFHQPNSNKLLKSSGIYQQLVMSSGLRSYFRSSLCFHIRKTLGRLSFAAVREVHTSASKAYVWKHLGSKQGKSTPCKQGKRREVSNEKGKSKYNRSFHRCKRKNSLSYICGWALGKLCFCPQLS